MHNLILSEAQQIVRAKYPNAWAVDPMDMDTWYILKDRSEGAWMSLALYGFFRDTEELAWLSAAERIKKQENENI